MSTRFFTIAAIAVAGLLVSAASASLAQGRDVEGTPGHRVQEQGSRPGYPGASGYAPGHQRRYMGDRDRDDRFRDRDNRSYRYSRHRGDRDRDIYRGDRDRDTYRGDRNRDTYRR
jgi:hypothetical protein